MYIRTNPWAEVCNPIPALEIKDILKKQASQSLALAFFDQYLSTIGIEHLIYDSHAAGYQFCLQNKTTASCSERLERPAGVLIKST